MKVDLAYLRESGLLDAIAEQAVAEYPNECCGILVDLEGALRRIPCRNEQDALHAVDPDTFPRTARTAFSIDPRTIMQHDRAIRVIYHSHPDHPARFSEEDERVAAPDGVPMYRGVAHLVVSVSAEGMGEARLYTFDDAVGRFVELGAGAR